MTQDIWFYAFILASITLGWVWGRLRSKFQPLYEIIAGLRLERDAQARTIEFQRKVISELERERDKVPNRETDLERYFREGRERGK